MALVSVPWMLLIKPFFLRAKHRKSQVRAGFQFTTVGHGVASWKWSLGVREVLRIDRHRVRLRLCGGWKDYSESESEHQEGKGTVLKRALIMKQSPERGPKPRTLQLLLSIAKQEKNRSGRFLHSVTTQCSAGAGCRCILSAGSLPGPLFPTQLHSRFQTHWLWGPEDCSGWTRIL